MKVLTNPCGVVRSLAAVGSALVAAFAGAQQTPPEQIVVTSSIVAQPRRQIGTAVSVIETQEIALRGYEDLAAVLRTQTGIGVSNSGGAGKTTSVYIRGEDSFRTLLMIDGVKAVDPSATQVTPSFDGLLATSDLQRVEVLRGPQGFIYGADAGGVVNVITKRGADELGGQLALEYGEYATRKVDAALSGGNDNGDYFVSAVDLQTDGFNAQTADTVLRDDDGADNTTLHAKLGWNVTDALRLQLVARDIDAEAQFDNCFGPPPLFLSSNDCVGTTDQQTYKLSADYTADRFTSSFGYSAVDIARDISTAGVSAFATEGKIARVEYTGSYKPTEALGVVYGVDLQDEELTDSVGVQSRDQNGYYVEYQGAFAGAFFVTLGARYDDNDDFGSHTSSRLSLAYVQELGANRSLKYRASMGTGFRAPSLFEVSTNRSAPFPPAAGVVLKEETSRGYDVGIEYGGPNGLRLEITYFDQKIDDAIEFDLVSFSGYLQSPGVSSSDGVELGANVPLGDRWQLLANWTYNETEDTAGQQRVRRPKNLGNFGVQYTAANERLKFLASYRLARDAIDTTFISTVPLPDYEVLDLSAAFDATAKLQIYGRVQNATDEQYQEIVGYNTAERSLYGGVRLRF
ncbi:MAG TPA: TonB-dependent receptor [Gammaproteobacteria bacterium]